MFYKQIALVLLMAILSTGLAFGADTDAPSPQLTAEEEAELIQLLNESFELLLSHISGLSDEQWNFKENPDRWSVAQCAQHIVRSERALLEAAVAALEGEPDDQWYTRTKGKTDLIRRVMPNRSPGGVGGATAPQEIRPNEDWSRAKAIKELYIIRGEVRAYIETLDKPIKEYTFEHPFPTFSWLTAHDWLIYIPLHTIRHSRQMIEVKEHKDYPKK